MTKKVKLIIIAVASSVLVIATVIGVVNAYVVGSTQSRILDTDALAFSEEYDCILVLGAGLRSDGTPSDMLKDRLDTAIVLYENGVCPKILLSGDRSGDDYDEVSAMREYCVSQGIPEDVIECDNFGFSTYESIHNASFKEYDNIIAVTQSYHLYRALYIADRMGLNAVGASADVRSYRGQAMRDVREVAARVKDFFAVNMFN